MVGRKPEISKGKASSQQFRIIPVWKKQIDKEKLARLLVTLALEQHEQSAQHDESTQQKKQQEGETSHENNS